MDENTKEKMLAAYEGRVKSTKRRHDAEKESLKIRHDREIQALENQYRNILKFKPSEVN